MTGRGGEYMDENHDEEVIAENLLPTRLEALEAHYAAKGNPTPLLAALMDDILGFKGKPRG
jgi:hypothetical protein